MFLLTKSTLLCCVYCVRAFSLAKVPERPSNANMRTTTTVAADHRGENESECFAIQRLQLLEYEYRSALRHLEKVRCIHRDITMCYTVLYCDMVFD